MGVNNSILNCIFTAPNGIGGPTNLEHKFFNCSFGAAAYTTANFSNCYSLYDDPANIFVNQTGNVFSYGHNFHLKSSYAAATTGTDGKQLGIYGGTAPYKDGAIPPNPHVRSRYVAPQTDANGKLHIEFNVSNNN